MTDATADLVSQGTAGTVVPVVRELVLDADTPVGAYARIVRPPFGVSTSDAYGWLDQDRRRREREDFSNGRFDKLAGPFFPHLALANDLEAPVIARHPLIGALRQRLAASGAIAAAMSGSGSTVYGVFATSAAASGAARRLEKDGIYVRRARFLPRRRR